MSTDRRIRSTDRKDGAWDLDHERAVRMEGRRYRPASLYNRPQLSEREAGKPQAAQGDLFATGQGRAATRLCRPAKVEAESDRTQKRDEDSARSQAARFKQWRADRG